MKHALHLGIFLLLALICMIELTSPNPTGGDGFVGICLDIVMAGGCLLLLYIIALYLHFIGWSATYRDDIAAVIVVIVGIACIVHEGRVDTYAMVTAVVVMVCIALWRLTHEEAKEIFYKYFDPAGRPATPAT